MRPPVLCVAVVACVVISFAAVGEVDNALFTLPPKGTTGRTLLQIKKNCPVNLETANYTEVTSRCKGPVYNESLCCAAFKDFACPYINDMTTNCAATMLSCLKLHGRYPPGLLANTCKDDLKNGLRCSEVEISDAVATAGVTARVPLVHSAFVFCVHILINVFS